MINLDKIAFFLFLCSFSPVTSIPGLCTVAQRWSIEGRAFVDEYKGKVLFLIFMRLDCSVCESTIRRCDSFMKYEAIAEHFNNEIKIVVVAPHSESDSRIKHLQSQYPTVRIAKESHQEPLWGWLKVQHNDGLVFDRCGRLAKTLQLPSEGIESSNIVFDSLKSILTGQPCGHCSHDRSDSKIQTTSQKSVPMITAYVSPSAKKQQEEERQNFYRKNPQEVRRQNSELRPENDRRQQNSNPRSNNYQEEERRQNSELRPETERARQNSNPRSSDFQDNQRRQQNPDLRFENDRRQQYSNFRTTDFQENDRRRQNSNLRSNDFQDNGRSQNVNPKFEQERRQNSNARSSNPQNRGQKQAEVEEYESVTVDYRRGSSEGKIFAQQQQPGVFNNDWVEVDSKSKFGKISDGNSKKANLPDNPETSENPDPIYPESDDPTSESDYYDYVADLTTPDPEQVQIPKPTSPSPSWPTKAPVAATGSGQNCAGYSDEICYQQYAQLDEAEVHHCCRKKVVLTDQCVPGKCSNVTQQLCCIQKFLQAKLTCCLDEKQQIPTSATDRFSRCCHDHFVTSDDSCCSLNYASAQWKYVHELCLPNVKLDLKDVKVKTYVPGTSVTTDFDFKYVKRWNFECRYGSHVPQYSYFENWYNLLSF